MVRWLADECVSARLVRLLREAGHDIAYAAEMAGGASDSEIIDMARRDDRLLLTDDKNFGDLVVRRRWTVPGVVLMRVATEQPQLRCQRLQAAIARFGDGLHGRYLVIEDARFRVRTLRG